MLKPVWAVGLLGVALICYPTGCSRSGGGDAPPPAAPAVAAEPNPPKAIFPDLAPYSTQMHLHGHSNHNGSPLPASMQWHSAWASLTGAADVLWWTDHAESLDQSVEVRCVLSTGKLDAKTLNVEDLKGSGITQLRATVAGGTPVAALSRDGLRFELQSEPSATSWQWLSYSIQSASGTVKSLRWTRPVSSGAVLTVEGDWDPSNPDALLEIEVGLAWHYIERQEQHKVVFRLVPNNHAGAATSLSFNEIMVPVGVPGGAFAVPLDLLAAASLLPDGADNTVSSVLFRIGSRAGATASAVLKSLSLRSTDPSPEHQLDQIRFFAASYAERYLLVAHVGTEYGTLHTVDLPHMNGFLPAPFSEPALVGQPKSPEDLAAWVREIHARGGLVSLNHVFGTNSGAGNLLPPAECETLGRSSLAKLLETQAHLADLMEVGYLARGGCDLRSHLNLWDALTANGLLLCGTGVTDSHGGVWKADMLPNPFTTWILSTGPEAPALLEALRDCRAYFGNPFLWNGVFAFQVGDARMGDRARPGSSRSPLTVTLDPWPADIKIFLVQGLIRPGEEVEYVHRGSRFSQGEEFWVDTSRPCFVRLEAYRDAEEGPIGTPLGIPIAFTNPILFL